MKTVIIPETTFVGVEEGGEFSYPMDGVYVDENPITVVFDGIKYENVPLNVVDSGNEYGAPYVDNAFDFSTYPFSIGSWATDEGDNT